MPGTGYSRLFSLYLLSFAHVIRPTANLFMAYIWIACLRWLLSSNRPTPTNVIIFNIYWMQIILLVL